MKHNLATDPPPRELLGALIDEHGVDAVLNPRSPAYKARELGSRTVTKREAIDLIGDDPNLMRRPLVISRGKAVFGYDAEAYDEIE